MSDARTIGDLVRRCYTAYESKQRDLLELILSADFTFTSPYDDHIDRDTYFERCWPNSEKVHAFTLEKVLTDSDSALVLYECQLRDGTRFRNMEYLRVAGEKICEVQVYFGDPPTDIAKEENLAFIKFAKDAWRARARHGSI